MDVQDNEMRKRKERQRGEQDERKAKKKTRKKVGTFCQFYLVT